MRADDGAVFNSAVRMVLALAVKSGWDRTVGTCTSALAQAAVSGPSALRSLSREVIEAVCRETGKAQILVASVQRVIDSQRFFDQIGQHISRFPQIFDEMYLASTAYGFGLYDAAVFHAMRLTEFLLKQVASCVGVPYAPSWDALRQKLSKEIDRRSATPSKEWKECQPFFASLLFDIQSISRACRNPALHDLTTHYSQDEAHRILTAVAGLSKHICEELPEGVLP